MLCPTCGKENDEGNVFCNWCGSKLTASNQSPSAASGPQSQVASQNSPVNPPSTGAGDEVRGVIVLRFDALKNKDEKTITAVLDENYSRFDD